jgi:hypothetical protein
MVMMGMIRLSLWHPTTEPASATLIAIRTQFIRLIGPPPTRFT